jgi:hypothetical protein
MMPGVFRWKNLMTHTPLVIGELLLHRLDHPLAVEETKFIFDVGLRDTPHLNPLPLAGEEANVKSTSLFLLLTQPTLISF